MRVETWLCVEPGAGNKITGSAVISQQRRSDLRALSEVPEAVVEAEKRKAEAQGPITRAPRNGPVVLW